MSEGGRSRRLESHEIEIGISEALSRHIARHVVAARPVTQKTLNYESRRPRWLRECCAEALGVFIFVYVLSIPNFAPISHSEDKTKCLNDKISLEIDASPNPSRRIPCNVCGGTCANHFISLVP